MSLEPIIDRSEIDHCFNILSTTLRKNCHGIKKKIGWQGDSDEFEINWNSDIGFWTVQNKYNGANRHVLWVGKDDPNEKQMLNIICEINPPHEGLNLKCAGLFVKDENGIYITHTGKVGGGKKGVGKSAFRKFYSHGVWETIRTKVHQDFEVLVIGPIDSHKLPSQIDLFTRQVQTFKQLAREGKLNSDGDHLWKTNVLNTPEFEGNRKGYRIPGEIEARCDHGLVINALMEKLESLGYPIGRDQKRDVFILDRNKRIKVLFEGKPDTSSTSLYQAIGQLFFHSANHKPSPRKILVIPDRPNRATMAILKNLGIEVLQFELENGIPRFEGLESLRI